MKAAPSLLERSNPDHCGGERSLKVEVEGRATKVTKIARTMKQGTRGRIPSHIEQLLFVGLKRLATFLERFIHVFECADAVSAEVVGGVFQIPFGFPQMRDRGFNFGVLFPLFSHLHPVELRGGLLL